MSKPKTHITIPFLKNIFWGRYEYNLYGAKINQNNFWKNPLRKGKSKATKMSDADFEKYTAIVNEIKNAGK